MTIVEANAKAQKINVAKLIGDSLKPFVVDVLSIQKEQMMEGKNIFGENIRPLYSENPYFKKPGAAQRYAEWKAKITPNAKRDKDAPNLFINGKFHSSVKSVFGDNEIKVFSDSSLGSKVLSVHKDVLGLNPEKAGQFAHEKVLPELLKNLRSGLGI